VLRDLRAFLLSHFLVVLMAMSSCWVLNIGHLLLTELCGFFGFGLCYSQLILEALCILHDY